MLSLFKSCSLDRLTAFAMADASGAKSLPEWIVAPVGIGLIILTVALIALLLMLRRKMRAMSAELEKSRNSLRALDENLPEVAMFQLEHNKKNQ